MLANVENQRLLSATLGRRYAVSNALDGSEFDLCIVDGITLNRMWAPLRALREEAEPVFLPVLLASDRGDIGLVKRDLWRVVDDVIVRPIEKSELRVRIEALLRARRLSLQLRRMANLYEHEREVAHRLQVAGLPRDFPTVPGVDFDAFYQPGSSEALIGGDWYDVFRLSDGRVVLTVGDVSGNGLEAAITMANVRQALRSVAQVHPDPGLMLDAADRTLAIEKTDRQVTAFVGVFDPVTGFLAYASAGHPPGLLRDRTGRITPLSTYGIPLGIDPRTERHAEIVDVPKESLLLVHTDGLTEADHDVLEGERRLHEALEHLELDGCSHPASELRNELLPHGSQDDVAILMMRTRTQAATEEALLRWQFHASDAASARAARTAMAEALRGRCSERGIVRAEVIFSELVGNVHRYAAGEVDIVLDIGAAQPVLHVLDRGTGFRLMPRLPYDTLSEHGRGLFIVNDYAEEFHVILRRGGGSHAIAVLRT